MEGKDSPGINTSASSFTLRPRAHGAPETIPLSPVCNTNSTSGNGSNDVINASSTPPRHQPSSQIGPRKQDSLMAASVAIVLVPC